MVIKTKKISSGKTSSAIHLALLLAVSLFNPACAIDNPDAPDYIAALELREKSYQQSINKPENSSRDYLIAFDDYQTFLDKELNKAYQLVMSKLPEARKAELKASQRQWIKYRDAEFELIKNNWSKQNFGSSSAISRGSYRCKLIKDRVVQLLDYAKNY